MHTLQTLQNIIAICTSKQTTALYHQSGPNNKQQSTTHGNASKGSEPHLILKNCTHINNISVQAQTPLQMIKVLTATGWGK